MSENERLDTNGFLIMRVLTEIFDNIARKVLVDAEIKGKPVILCAFDFTRRCSRNCAAAMLQEGRVICQRDGGLIIGHLEGEFEAASPEETVKNDD